MRRRKRAAQSDVPVPVTTDQRICFGIAYFQTEEDAKKYDEAVRKQGRTYNGGWFHGMPCGREAGWDYVDAKLGQLYAVTH